MATRRIKDNKRLIDTGKAAIHDDCCCDSCDNYSPPSSISVTFDNVVECAGSNDCTDECKCSDYIGGTHNLSYIGLVGGRWAFEINNSNTCDVWEHPGTHVCENDDMDFVVKVSLDCIGENLWKILVTAAFDINGGAFNPSGYCFRMTAYDTITFGDDPVVVNNDNTSCSPTPHELSAEDGTANVYGLWD